MADAERVVGALGADGEAADAVFGPVGPEGLAAAGQDLMGIGLVADVEDDLVGGRVVDVMEGRDDFHGAEARCEVAGVFRAAADHVIPDLGAEHLQVRHGEALEVGGAVDPVQKPVFAFFHKGGLRYDFLATFEKNS